MPAEKTLKHKFVEFMPDALQEDTVYVSIPYATVTHKCCCGCGEEVVTPLSPTDWKLIFDGETISLTPSIGNWSFKCQSHYWIRGNKVEWAAQWSKEEINAGRSGDARAKEKYFSQTTQSKNKVTSQAIPAPKKIGFWEKLTSWRT